MNNLRKYRWFDKLIFGVENLVDTTFSSQSKKESAALMRVNHTGEVCAQALYQGQSLTTPDPELKKHFQQAAKEEADHLRWCAERIDELGSYTSFLNPLFFAGSFLLGASWGLMGNQWSLGFLAETEKQVSAHLQKHLQQLPLEDEKSKMILQQMLQDEEQHATHAVQLGARPIPSVIKITMSLMSTVMTSTTYYI